MPPKGSRSKTKSRAAEPEIFDGNDSVSDGQVHQDKATTTSPAKRRSKRKAAQEEADDASTKKPKVAVHTTEVEIAASYGKPAQHQTHRNVQLEIPLSSMASKPTGKRIVFNNDDVNDDNDDLVSPDGPNEFFTPQGSPTIAVTATSTQQPQASDEDDENESDSDDDAPEAVSTHTAAAQAAKSAQAAAHAAGKQRDAERQRRQERDARLKAQAGLRKKQPPKKQEEKDSDSDLESEAEAEAEEKEKEKETRAQTAKSGTKPKRFTKNNLPDLLPEELLASDSESEDNEEDQREKRRPTVIKFNTVARQVAKAESQQSADQRVGSTVYRVMKKKADERLAPRGGKYSRNAKEGLLARMRPGSKSRTTTRTTSSSKGGFLIKR